MIALIEKFLLEDFEIVIKRKNIKNMYLRVSPPNGDVIISAPFKTKNEDIVKFITNKKYWIKDKRGEMIKKKLNYMDWTNEEVRNGKNLLKEKVPFYINKWEPILNVHVDSWYTRLMKTRWGTCNIKTRRICINLSLSRKNDDILEYVIVHEMIHLKERLHNKEFYSHMGKHIPKWKEYKQILSES